MVRRAILKLFAAIAITNLLPVAQPQSSDDAAVRKGREMMKKHHSAISEIAGERKKAADLSRATRRKLDDMAAEEEALYKELAPEQRRKVYEYGVSLFQQESGDVQALTAEPRAPATRRQRTSGP